MAFSALYFLTAIPRVVYPYDLDFVEDSMLMQSLRVADGRPVYVPPGADFAPHVYMPLYAWLGGLLLKLTGPSFVPLRLLSLGATLAIALLLYRIAQRESGQRWIAIACAGLWLGGYEISAGWYELVRVDAWFVMLSLAGMALGIYARESDRRLVASAVVMALAFLTKQSGVIFAFGLGLYLLIDLGRRAWLFVIAFGVLALVPVLLLNMLTDGWFVYHAFGIAFTNPIEIERIVGHVRFELFGSMAGLSVMAVLAGLIGLRRSGLRVIRGRPWWIAIAAAILISAIGRASVGGAANNLMPAYALLCLAPAVLMHEWTKEQGRTTNDPLRPSSFVLRHVSEWIAAAITIQFALVVYNPGRFIPTQAMREAGDRFVERIAAIDGAVFVMMHPYYAVLAGKQPSAQIATVWYGRDRGRLPLPEALVNRIQHRYYAAIISDESEFFETDPALVALIEANYVRSEELGEFDAPPTLTGVVVRPRTVYVPRPQQ